MSSDLFDFETDTTLQPSAEVAPAPKHKRRSRRYGKLNTRFSYFVALSAPIAAIPIALNRPSLWLIWGMVTACAVLLYLALGRRYDPRRSLLSARHPWLFGLALVIPGFAMVQVLPLGSILGPLLGWPEAVGALQVAPRQISVLPDATALAALRVCFYILFALLAIEVAGRLERATRVAWWVFWGIVAHALWAMISLRLLGDTFFWGEKSAYFGSATGTFLNRNSFATFLAMGLCLGFALLLDRGNVIGQRRADRKRLLNPVRLDAMIVWMGLGIITVTLLNTQSRMGVVAAVVGVFVCLLLMRLKSGKPFWRYVLGLVALGGVAVVTAAFVLGDALLNRAIFTGNDWLWRATGYQFAWELIQARPLTGYGFEAFRPTFEMVHRPPMVTSVFWDRAHSTYLSYWSEMGLIIGSVPLVMGGIVLHRLVDVIRRRKADFALSVAALSVLVVGAVHSLVDFSLEMPANVVLFLTILALGITHRVDPALDEETSGS